MGVLSFFKKESEPVETLDSLIEAEESAQLPELRPVIGASLGGTFQDLVYDGEKFAGGFGLTGDIELDYWTLRTRSAQLFKSNPYARGIIRRFVTNVMGPGLMPEAVPAAEIVGQSDDWLADWSETIETRFGVWAQSKPVCDFYRKMTFGEIQQVAKLEAYVAGDVLVFIRQNSKTKTPQVQLINGATVVNPIEQPKKGNTIIHGVELDSSGRHVAYWVENASGEVKRLAAISPSTGRMQAYMVYGTDKRLNDVRGEPILSLVLQSLREIDRYKDAALRKAVINSLLAMFVKNTMDKMPSMPISGGAVKRGAVDVAQPDGSSKPVQFSKHVPGMVIESLQHGEEIQAFGHNGTDVSFGPFEESIVQSMAWAIEMPPEILRLSFSSNYSASQAAINELKMFINKEWINWGNNFCAPIYEEFLLSDALSNKITAPGFLDAWRNPEKYDVYNGWLLCEWYGSIKPSTDMLKQAKGSKLLVDNMWSTNARESRNLTGTKFSTNTKRLKRENELKAEAMRPMLELQQEFGEQAVDDAAQALDRAEEIEALVDGYLDDKDLNNE